MADFQVETIGNDPNEMADKVSSLASGAGESTNEGLLEAAEEIKKEIEEEAPVDTGAFENSWYIQEVAEGEVWILSDSDAAPHNKFIMLPNSRFQGHPDADNPATGVYFDAEAIAKANGGSVSTGVNGFLRDLIQRIRG